MRTSAAFGICVKAVRRFSRRKRALFALLALASLFVVLSIISPAATGQAGAGPGATSSGVGQATGAGGAPSSGNESAETPADVPDPGLGNMAFKVIGSVLLLIGVLYAGMYAMRMLSGRTGKGGFNSDTISVLHKTHIAPKKAIYVVKVGGKGMVVGVTDTQINHLSDLSEEELDALKSSDKPVTKDRSFKKHLLGLTLGGRER